MFHGFFRTLITIASLVVGTIMTHFGVTPDKLIKEVGLTQDQALALVRLGFDWALPNLMLGALVIVPVWFLVYLFQPPRRRID